ncbi:hypothetical protein B0E53_05337 [Micromonospora sp. MH33]|uniref:hypothetical protein n=1 Tax=Micromonospora sp. MH33 TaxID=1945509 RepID=UPI000D14932E|nr:hypothetical protein [Micromonospora sp. MH33]PSK62762.1 hypothetical protein B0E53_05337 [Micromonospora sp. MH33]
MIDMIAALQPLVVGAVLIWSARVKLLNRHAATAARRSALAPLLGEDRALPAYRLLGVVELTLGALLVLPPGPRLESAVALADRPIAGGAVLLAEAAAVVALSPELDAAWLLPLRRLRARLTNPLRGGSGLPLLATVQQVQLSDSYRRVAPLLRSDVREHWNDGDWRFVGHAARYQGRPATAVFAVPLVDDEPEAVRVAIVDDATGQTLLALAGAGQPAGPRLDVVTA